MLALFERNKERGSASDRQSPLQSAKRSRSQASDPERPSSQRSSARLAAAAAAGQAAQLSVDQAAPTSPFGAESSARYAATVDTPAFALCRKAAKSRLADQYEIRESFVQSLMTVVHVFCLAFVNSEMGLRDTHLKHGPEGGRPDFSFAIPHTVSYSGTAPMHWQHWAFGEEEKKKLSDTTEWSEALLQAHHRLDRVSAALASAFPGSVALVQLTDGHQSVVFAKDGDATFGTERLLLLPSEHERGQRPKEQDGLRLYLSILNTTMLQRLLNTDPFSFTVPRGVDGVPVDTQLEMRLLRRTSGKSIYQHNALPWVIKKFVTPARLKREEEAVGLAMAAVDKSKAAASITRLVESAIMVEARRVNPGVHFLLLTPVADDTLGGVACTADLFVSACHAGASVLKALHNDDLVHGDLSLTNMLVRDNKVLVNDFGSTTRLPALCKHITATTLFCSCFFEDKQPYKPDFDWEALFYVLVAFARRTAWALKRHRRSLPFEDVIDAQLQQAKAADLFKSKVLALVEKDATALGLAPRRGLPMIQEEPDSQEVPIAASTGAGGMAQGAIGVVPAATAVATPARATVAPAAGAATEMAVLETAEDMDSEMGAMEEEQERNRPDEGATKASEEEAARTALATALPILKALQLALRQPERDNQDIHRILANAAIKEA